MKALVNSALLFILIIFPILPSYLHLYNQISNPELELCSDNGNSKKIRILKGDLAYLEAIFSRAMENKKNSKEEPTSQVLNSSVILLFFTAPSKIDFINPYAVINKVLYSKHNNLSTIYLKIPSPPPKYIS